MAGRTVSIELGGETRQILFNLNVLADIGERLGLSVRLDHLGEDIVSEPLPLSAPRTIIWAALQDDEVTEKDVGGWVDQDNAAEVMQAFFSLFDDSVATQIKEAFQMEEATL